MIKTCNDGVTIAHSTNFTNNGYTSELNVIVSPEMHNETVECVQHGPGIHLTSVETCTLILATGKHNITMHVEAPECTMYLLSILNINQLNNQHVEPPGDAHVLTSHSLNDY